MWVLDDAAEPEPGDVEETSPDLAAGETSRGECGRRPSPSEDFPLVGLHAKVYVVDEGWNASVFTGSANATHAAFSANVEFLTQLRGKRSVCGVEAVLGRSMTMHKQRTRKEESCVPVRSATAIQTA